MYVCISRAYHMEQHTCNEKNALQDYIPLWIVLEMSLSDLTVECNSYRVLFYITTVAGFAYKKNSRHFVALFKASL